MLSLKLYGLLPSLLSDQLKYTFKYIYFSPKLNNLRFYIYATINQRKLNKKHQYECENYLRFNIGCGNNHFPGYINVDNKKTGATDYVCDVINLPFPDESAEVIETSHLLFSLRKEMIPPALKNWWAKLIPGGKLVIDCLKFGQVVNAREKDNREMQIMETFSNRSEHGMHSSDISFYRLKLFLEKYGFKGVKRCVSQNHSNTKEAYFRIQAYKSIAHKICNTSNTEWTERKKRRPETLTLEWRKNHLHCKIISEFSENLIKGEKIISIGCGTGELETLLGKDDHSIVGVDISSDAIKIANKHKDEEKLENIQFVCSSAFALPFRDRFFNAGFAVEVIEHIEPDKLRKILNEIKRVLKPDAKLLITTPNKNTYQDPGHRQYFTKATLTKCFDEFNISFDWIDVDEREDKYRKHNLLKALLRNKFQNDPQQNKRICGMGAFVSNGYTQLGFHWDGQTRAFRELGFQTLFLDIRKNKNYEILRQKILDFEPDILWCGLKDCLPFIKWMENDVKKLRNRGTKVIYWYCDIREPEPINLHNLVDVMFLSNSGQIEEYKKAYSIDRIYYMPQACSPQFMHRLDFPEIYDIGFAGTVNGFLHERRGKILKKLSKKYKVAIKNSVRNNISNFYSRCRIVFGMNPAINSHLYTSNRLFIALGCGAFYMCEYFPGIEKLANNREHLVWFEDKKELYYLIDHYLKKEAKREKIRKSAQFLAHSKHTYTARIQNMLDIIECKTDRFNGFL